MDRFLANKTVLRIIAVALSVILWFGVQLANTHAPGGTNSLDKFPRPIQVQTAAGMVVTSIQPAVISLEVNDNLLTTALSEQMLNVEVVADARSLSAGTHVIQLKALNIPPIQYQLNPSTVTITLAHKDTASKAVKIVLQGKAKAGFTVGDPSSNVSSVTLSGAKNELNQVAEVQAVVQLNGASSNLSEQVDLTPVDHNGQTVSNVTVNPATATINIPIQSPETNVVLNPVPVGTPMAGYTIAGITVSPSNVKAYGENAPSQIQLPVDVSGLNSTQTLTLSVPQNSNISQLSPAKVSVTVSIEPSETKKLTSIPIQVRNLKSGQQVILPGATNVTIQVTGPKSVMDALSTSDVTAYIDASKLTAKDSQATVLVNTPQWVTVTQLSSTQVPVQVTG